MSQTILVVEDDGTLQETLVYNLEKQGYMVVATDNGRIALQHLRQHHPDLIVLDIMLPGLDGFEVCRLIRKESSVPILMLTARTEEIDKIVGLEMGADDYLTKPFSMRELLARVKAQLRRVTLVRQDVEAEQPVTADLEATKSLLFGNMKIDQSRREVLLDDSPLRMKPKEYELLTFLARHRGIALSRDLILERVWGWTYDGNSRTVDVHVRWLREKIEPNPNDVKRIVTVRGVGYRFEG